MNEDKDSTLVKKFWNSKDIDHRNQQLKELEMSNNARSPQGWQIETKDKEGNWTWRMMSSTKGYLESNGRKWIDLKFCEDYRITPRKNTS